MKTNHNEQWTLDTQKVRKLIEIHPESDSEIEQICAKALELKGLYQEDAAKLLNVSNPQIIQKILETAGKVKEIIYGRRMVIFAPLYTGNICSNDCTYCGFRKSNHSINRSILNTEQIHSETINLLKEGHKRLLMLCGESKANDLDYFLNAIKTVYSAEWNGNKIKRINVEIAPLTTDEFKKLKTAGIGTYACFQETYDPDLYKEYHTTGPKSDYNYRLNVMHRAMAGGIDDVGIGVLFGLSDYRFEVLSMLEHAASLEAEFGCGPHTVSVPRIEPADGVSLSTNVPYKVSDDEFRKIIAVLRLSLPYTGIILSTRENETLRNELFQYGISQISAGSRTNPGAYSDKENGKGSQFSLGDHRSLSEVIDKLIESKYIPSFCTGCYRKGRVGNDFMDLAKPGLIHQFCMPNGLFTFQEYLEEFADSSLKQKGELLINNIVSEVHNEKLKSSISTNLDAIKSGDRDLYF